jgi:hypothetical protein
MMIRKPETKQAMNYILWTVQGVLALTLIWAGFMKIIQPEKLPFPWVKDHPDLVFFTGFFDLLAGTGIVFPALLRIQPRLTIYAAYGIIMLMVAACIFHISRGESKDIGFNVFMIKLAVFVAWGRQKKVPVSPEKS